MDADFFTHTPAPAPSELKVPYVAPLFTRGFQMFPFAVIHRCDQSAVQHVFATVRLITVSRVYLLPALSDAVKSAILKLACDSVSRTS